MTVTTASPRLGEAERTRPVLVTPAAFRRGFPMLERTVHLASCSLGARSDAVDEALERMQEAIARHGAPWHRFEQEVDDARQRFASLIGAGADQIAVLPNASVGAYQVVSTLSLKTRDEIVTTVEEFPSVAHVWLAQQPRGARVLFTGDDSGRVRLADYTAVVGARTALVSVPLSTYKFAERPPVAEVVAAGREAGALTFVDAYQAVGVMPVDVTELGCDYLVAGTMKYLAGLPGVAFLYAREGVEPDQDPQLTGWFGRVEPMAFDPLRLDFPAIARRFETGTPAVPALYAANAALALFTDVDLADVRRHIEALIERTARTLTSQGERVRRAESPERQGAHLGLYDNDPPALAGWLAGQGIAVSPRGPVVRLSFHYYNSTDDVEALCQAMREFRALAGPATPSRSRR
ncbi:MULTISPECIES: aminotransferase class V-fold PLP-dependent enzyme [Streptomyces]|uniref:aminotransferase class V-fold PLP-dependent enzyme n=1 Tax=Streptomyces TaxID=1883 RepID=UPI001C3F66BF|nr:MULTISPECIES: aminotransferase class V-fold PLP-dependent enzyme [Streptomyces]